VIQNNGSVPPVVPFAEDLVFYAPLTEGDLTDHISGVTGVERTGGTLTYDSNAEMYHIYSEGDSSSSKGGLYFGDWQAFDASNGITMYIYAQEVPSEISGNSFSAIISIPLLTANTSTVYICNYRYTNKTYYQQFIQTASKLVVVWNTDGSVSYYRDGTFVRTDTGWTGRSPFTCITIGQLHTRNTKYGLLFKDARVYNRALTAQEVAQL
jgi:hypothetical protein